MGELCKKVSPVLRIVSLQDSAPSICLPEFIDKFDLNWWIKKKVVIKQGLTWTHWLKSQGPSEQMWDLVSSPTLGRRLVSKQALTKVALVVSGIWIDPRNTRFRSVPQSHLLFIFLKVIACLLLPLNHLLNTYPSTILMSKLLKAVPGTRQGAYPCQSLEHACQLWTPLQNQQQTAHDLAPVQPHFNSTGNPISQGNDRVSFLAKPSLKTGRDVYSFKGKATRNYNSKNQQIWQHQRKLINF